MLQWIKRFLVPILCIIGLLSPIVGMKMIETYYFSTVFGWIIGFCCFVTSYIIVSKRPDEEETTPASSVET